MKLLVALRSKCYSLKFKPIELTEEKEKEQLIKDDGDGYRKLKNEIVKSKGIKRSVIEKEIFFENLKSTLFTGVLQLNKQIVFKSILHNIITQEQQNVSLSSNDDKSFSRKNEINTYA